MLAAYSACGTGGAARPLPSTSGGEGDPGGVAGEPGGGSEGEGEGPLDPEPGLGGREGGAGEDEGAETDGGEEDGGPGDGDEGEEDGGEDGAGDEGPPAPAEESVPEEWFIDQLCPPPGPEAPAREGGFELAWELYGKGGGGGCGDLEQSGRAAVWYLLSGRGHREEDPEALKIRVVSEEDRGLPVERATWSRFAPRGKSYGDLDGDGLLEIVGDGPRAEDRRSSNLLAISQPEPGRFPSSEWEVFPSTPTMGRDCRIADLQGDGSSELIMSNTPVVYEWAPEGIDRDAPVVEHQGRGPLGQWRFSVSAVTGFNVGDFDGDGRQEFAYGVGRAPNRGADTLRIIEPTAAGEYVVTWEAPLPLPQLVLAAEGDVDGDGKPELMRGGKALDQVTFGACWWFGLLGADGDDQYSVRWDQWVFGGGLGDVGMADMGDTDGDGDDEVLLSRGEHVTVFELDRGTGGFYRILDVPWWHLGDQHMEVRACDTDGDGRDEVVVFAGRHDVQLGPERSVAVKVFRRM